MRIQPALTDAVRYAFNGSHGALYFDRTADQNQRTELTGFIQSHFTYRSLGFQFSLDDLLSLNELMDRFDTRQVAEPGCYIEMGAGRVNLSFHLRGEGEPGLTVVANDLSREIGDRLIAMLDLSSHESQRLKEMARAIRPTRAAQAA